MKKMILKAIVFSLCAAMLFSEPVFNQESEDKEQKINNLSCKFLKTINSFSNSHSLVIIDRSLNYSQLTLDGSNRPEVQQFRELYQKEQYRKLLSDSLENAVEYRLYVRKAIADAGLPPELEYLPVVESFYKTNAKSRSGALGMWQFMANSVKPYLKLNDYVDERLDPWYETEAALKKLQENYRMFGDWLIAIAAYNCGAGAMTRALAKAEIKSFWYLCEKELIPLQTRQYVPKLIAIADLVMNTQYYENNIPLHETEYESLFNEKNGLFDFITVNRPYSLKQLARAMRIDTDELIKLNPSFTQGCTHPKTESKIRLPLGMEETALKALETIEPLDIPIKYKVVKGDTLWGIAKKHGTTVKAICELNNIKENSVLSIGKILYVPQKISR
ncbi:MAG: transglycosylase SLT domain-containing protein [Treponema sp.]|nr:transglycosylase SLT domain-containing protein [Treponema sp.]